MSGAVLLVVLSGGVCAARNNDCASPVAGAQGAVLYERLFDHGEEEGAFAVASNPGGGYTLAGNVLVGESQSFEGGVLEIGPDGSVGSFTRSNGPASSDFFDLASRPEGGFVLVGQTFEPDQRGYVAFSDDDGALISARSYEPGLLSSVEPSPEGGFIVAGFTTQNASDCSVIKLATDGEVLWSRLVGGVSTYERCRGAVAMSDGGALIYGWRDPGSGDFDLFLARLDREGDLTWARALGTVADDLATEVVKTEAGFLLAGTTDVGGDLDILLVELDAFGFVIWAHSYGTESVDRTGGLVLSDAGPVVAGRAGTSGLLMHAGWEGSLEWARGFSEMSRFFTFRDLVALEDGFIVVGSRGSTFPEGPLFTDFYFAHANTTGFVGCTDEAVSLTSTELTLRETVVLGMVSGPGGTAADLQHSLVPETGWLESSCETLFADGFESGDLSAWSVVVP